MLSSSPYFFFDRQRRVCRQQVWSGSGKTQAVRVAMDTPIFWSEPNFKTDSNVEKQIVGMGPGSRLVMLCFKSKQNEKKQ